MMLNQVADANDDKSVREQAIERMSVISVENFYHISNDSVGILATALVPVLWNGRSIVLRALIDQGSTANLITSRACQALQLTQQRSNMPMTGVGGSPVGTVIAKTLFTFGSIYDVDYRHDVESIVVKSIADTRGIDLSQVDQWLHIKRLSLADPQFFENNKVDLLLGTAAYAEIVMGDIRRGEINEPIAQQTKLGWIVFGAARIDYKCQPTCNAIIAAQCNDTAVDLTKQLQKFWQLEEVKPSKFLTPDEQAAEDIFTTGQPQT